MNLIIFVHMSDPISVQLRVKKKSHDWKFFLQAHWKWKNVKSNETL